MTGILKTRISKFPRLAAVLSGGLLLGLVSTADAALIKSYDFTTGLSDTLGNGVDLTGIGTVSGGRYSFTNNQGLRLTSALPSTTDYAIEMKLRVDDSVAGFNKLVDFQDLLSDVGLYVLGGTLDFFTAGPSAGVITVATEFTVGLERAGGTITGFLNGVSVFSSLDGGQAVSGSNILNFFEDDIATGQSESFTGSADWIRIHNDSSTFGTTAIPAPASLALFGLAVAGLGFARRKRAV